MKKLQIEALKIMLKSRKMKVKQVKKIYELINLILVYDLSLNIIYNFNLKFNG